MSDDYKTAASRQFLHNDGSGFVVGYDVEIIDKTIEELKAEVEYCHSARKQSDHVIKSLESEVERLKSKLKDSGKIVADQNQIPQSVNDEIERLRGGWISCADRLPDVCAYYLAYLEIRPDCQHTDVVYWNDGFDDMVTHWQPLPQPPSEDL